MPRNATDSLTPREAQIMGALWESGSATAETIRKRLDDDSHDSSVRTFLRVLEDKGYVQHTVVGKSYLYHPVVQRDSAQSQAATSLLKRLFSGSAASLVLRLLEDDEISPEELQRLADQARSVSRQADRPKSPIKRKS